MTQTAPKTTLTTVTSDLRKQEVRVFPPRDRQEAESLGVFVADSGVTYCHFNGTLTPALEDAKPIPGLVHAYGELADKLGELLVDQVKNHRTKHLDIIADVNQEVIPESVAGQHIGNHVKYKVWGFRHGGYYYTTKGGQLIVSEVREDVRQTRTSRIDFF